MCEMCSGAVMYSVDTDARNDQDVERNITVAELKTFERFEDVAAVASCISMYFMCPK